MEHYLSELISQCDQIKELCERCRAANGTVTIHTQEAAVVWIDALQGCIDQFEQTVVNPLEKKLVDDSVQEHIKRLRTIVLFLIFFLW